MTQIDNPQQIYTLSLSYNDLLPFAQSNFTKVETLKSILHSSLLAIWQRSQENLVSFPIHKLLTFSIKSNTNIQGLTAINSKTIKQLLTIIVKKTKLQRNENLLTLTQEKQREVLKKLFTQNTFNRILRQQFQKILSKIMDSLKHSFDPSLNIDFQWKRNTWLEIFQNNYSLAKESRNIHENKEQQRENIEKVDQVKKDSGEDKILFQLKQMLSKLSGNSKVKLDLYKLFQSNNSLLKAKELQIQQWVECSHQLKETVNNQMSWIELMSSQNSSLENTIEELRKQLKVNEDRLKVVQTQITELQSELAEIKMPSAPTYYINPFYEKSQLQQKMLTEMIEIESQLFLGKQQIKLLSDSMINLIKTCQNVLQDLRVSKYYVSKFNCSAYTILKDIKSMQGYDLQSMNIKQQSMYGSEIFSQTRKSQSNFSELSLDVKQSRIFTEEDSLSGQQQNKYDLNNS